LFGKVGTVIPLEVITLQASWKPLRGEELGCNIQEEATEETNAALATRDALAMPRPPMDRGR